MDEFLARYKKACDEMVESYRRNQQINEEFRHKMLSLINGLNALIPELLEQVNSLVGEIKDSTINAIEMQKRLNALNIAANIITTETQTVQSNMTYDEPRLRRGEVDERTLLYAMFTTTSNTIADLFKMVGNLTVEYANSILQEKSLSDQLDQVEQGNTFGQK